MMASSPEDPEIAWQSFVLQPFQSGDLPPGPRPAGSASPGTGLELSGRIRCRGGALELCLRLGGDLESVALPESSTRPERRDDLWRSTCFELFLAAEGQPEYWEVNLSPAGHWNVYRFCGYRRGMETEPSLRALPFAFRSGSGVVELELAWPLPDDLRSSPSALVAGVCAVIEQQQGQLSYWAVIHPGKEADFHRRDGLVLRL